MGNCIQKMKRKRFRDDMYRVFIDREDSEIYIPPSEKICRCRTILNIESRYITPDKINKNEERNLMEVLRILNKIIPNNNDTTEINSIISKYLFLINLHTDYAEFNNVLWNDISYEITNALKPWDGGSEPEWLKKICDIWSGKIDHSIYIN